MSPGRVVLVVGASGVLRPATEILRDRGRVVVGVGRGVHPMPSGVAEVAVDARDAGALRDAIAPLRWVDALVYSGATSEGSLAVLQERTPGRTVHVRTLTDVGSGGRYALSRLQLGRTGDDARPWHSPQEISAAALAVLDDGVDRVLGIVDARRPGS